MAFTLVSLLFASPASLAFAQKTEFWWSFRASNSSEYGYNPAFEVCGSSCSNCTADAKQCRSDSFSNICYEPLLGETCCNDVWGTACYKDFYCAYNDAQVAFCCADDTKPEDCGAIFNEVLSSTVREVPTATVVVTQVFAPTYTATTDQAAARPNQTPLPSGYNALTKLHPKTSKPIFSGLSKGAKIGIIIAAISAIIALIGLAAFFFFRRGRNEKYNQIRGAHVGKNDGHAEQHIPLVAQQQQHPMSMPPAPYQPSPLPMHASPAPSYTAPVYEPMRNEPPHEYHADYKHPYTTSTAPPVAPQFYSDNPATGSGTARGGANVAELPSAEAYK